MTRKTRHTKSRKQRHSRKRTTHRRRTHRKQGGNYYQLNGAPLGYHLSGDWSSKMSLGQGQDFFKYHKGQHGGEAPVDSIGKVLLDSPQLVGSAHQGGLMKAYADIAGLKDQTGGKRSRSKRSRSTKRKSHKRKQGGKHRKTMTRRKTMKRRRTMKRKQGGGLGYAPVSAPGMLLSSPQQYSQAGLNPHWKDVEYMDAKIRDSQ